MLDVPGTDPWSGRLVRGRGHIIAALGLGAQWLSLLPHSLLVLGRPQKPVQATAAAILGLRPLDGKLSVNKVTFQFSTWCNQGFVTDISQVHGFRHVETDTRSRVLLFHLT